MLQYQACTTCVDQWMLHYLNTRTHTCETFNALSLALILALTEGAWAKVGIVLVSNYWTLCSLDFIIPADVSFSLQRQCWKVAAESCKGSWLPRGLGHSIARQLEQSSISTFSVCCPGAIENVSTSFCNLTVFLRVGIAESFNLKGFISFSQDCHACGRDRRFRDKEKFFFQLQLSCKCSVHWELIYPCQCPIWQGSMILTEGCAVSSAYIVIPWRLELW